VNIDVNDDFGAYLPGRYLDDVDGELYVAVNVDFGDGTGVQQVILAPEQSLAQLSGENSGSFDASGLSSIASIGDVNGDGRPDYLTGDEEGVIRYWGSTEEGGLAGPVEIYSGGPGPVVFGALGNVDGEGESEWYISEPQFESIVVEAVENESPGIDDSEEYEVVAEKAPTLDGDFSASLEFENLELGLAVTVTFAQGIVNLDSLVEDLTETLIHAAGFEAFDVSLGTEGYIRIRGDAPFVINAGSVDDLAILGLDAPVRSVRDPDGVIIEWVGNYIVSYGRVRIFEGVPGVALGEPVMELLGGSENAGFGAQVLAAGNLDRAEGEELLITSATSDAVVVIPPDTEHPDERDEVLEDAGSVSVLVFRSSSGAGAAAEAAAAEAAENPGDPGLQAVAEALAHILNADDAAEFMAWTARGTSANERFGTSAGVGDVNGDGINDVLVGAPGGEAGRLYVYHGLPELPETEDGFIAGSQYVAGSSAPSFYLNEDIAFTLEVGGAEANIEIAAGDYQDIDGLIGSLDSALQSASGLGAFSAFRSRVDRVEIIGNVSFVITAGDTENLSVLGFEADEAGDVVSALLEQGIISEDPSVVIDGSAAGGGFGTSVTYLGDVNGDGFGDVLVGSRSGEGVEEGRVDTLSLYYGGGSGLSAAAGQVIEAVGFAASFADTVLGAGDFDGDGLADLVVRGYLDDGPDSVTTSILLYRGQLYSGSPGDDPDPEAALEGISPVPIRLGDAAGLPEGLASRSLDTPGDINADGRPDILALSGDGIRVFFGADLDDGVNLDRPAVASSVLAAHTYAEPGHYSIRLSAAYGIDSGGEGLDAVSLTGDVLELSLDVGYIMPEIGDLQGGSEGFTVYFTRPVVGEVLNLYEARDSDMGEPDVSFFESATGRDVPGTLILDDNGLGLRFVPTGGPLAAGNYTVFLRSAETGFKGENGRLLDGDSDGVEGGDFEVSFEVAGLPAEAVIFSIPDFARGPGEEVHLGGPGTGIPVYVSGAVGLGELEVQLMYDPAILEITGVNPGPGMPAGDLNITTEEDLGGLNLLTVEFVAAGEAVLQADTVQAFTLEGRVVSGAPGGQAHLLDLIYADFRRGEIVTEQGVVLDDGIHSTSYRGDLDGDGHYGADDVSRALGLILGLDSGFVVDLGTDPQLMGDINGNGTVGVMDARAILRKVVWPEEDIPGLPGLPVVIEMPIRLPGGEGVGAELASLRADVTISQGLRAKAGEVVTAVVTVNGAAGIRSAELTIGYDPDIFEVPEGGVRGGDLLSGQLYAYRVDSRSGEVIFAVASGQEGTGDGVLVEIDLRVLEDAREGETLLDLHRFILNDGEILFVGTPAVGGDSLDSLVEITAENQAPVFDSVDDPRVKAGDQVRLHLRARDPDGDSAGITYRLIRGPASASIDSATGIFSWDPVAGDVGVIHEIVVEAVDRGQPAGRALLGFSIEVLASRQLAGPGERAGLAELGAAPAAAPRLNQAGVVVIDGRWRIIHGVLIRDELEWAPGRDDDPWRNRLLRPQADVDVEEE